MLVAAALVTGVLNGACSDDTDPPPSPVSTTTTETAVDLGGDQVERATLTDMVAGLCDARRLAAGGDIEAARTAFFDRSHDTLHAVARGLEAGDRTRAARLLEAKQRVEADLEGSGTTTPGPADDLAALVTLTRDGLDVLGVDTPECAA